MLIASLLYGVNGLNVFSGKSFHMIETFLRKFIIIQEIPLDLIVENIAVHRISYVDTFSNKIDKVTSVVVTWEEHEVARQLNEFK
jgi:hypothetical protein